MTPRVYTNTAQEETLLVQIGTWESMDLVQLAPTENRTPDLSSSHRFLDMAANSCLPALPLLSPSQAEEETCVFWSRKLSS